MRRAVLLALALALPAAADNGMMGVGRMMSPTNGAGVAPETFRIVTQAGDPLVTQTGVYIVTQE